MPRKTKFQLPPCTSKPPFVCLRGVYEYFDFKVLRENRRVVKDSDGSARRQEELEDFHRVLLNISEGKATRRVRDFIVEAYVRGATSCGGRVENVGFEGSTAVSWGVFPVATWMSRPLSLGIAAIQAPLQKT